MAKLTPHQKIIRAYYRGTGLRLTAQEIVRLGTDDAIMQTALNDQHDADLIAHATKTPKGDKK